MHRDEIRHTINIVHLRGKFRADGFGTVLGQVRIVSDDAHPEGPGPFGHFRTNAAHAQNAEGFVEEFDALEQFAVPLAGGHGRVGLRHFARQRQQHGKTQFRRGYGVATGRIHHHDAALRRRRHVHIVHADAGAANGAQFWSGFNHLAGDLGFGTHQQSDGVRHQRQQFRLRQALGQNHHFKFRPLLE